MELESQWKSVEDSALEFVGRAEYSQLEATLQFFGADSPIANKRWFYSKLTNELLVRMGIENCPNPITPSALVDHLLNLGKPVYKIQ